MYFEGTGTGKPLILLAPGLTCGEYWSETVATFSQQYNVIVPEARGNCQSTGMDRDISYHLMAEDYIKLMDYLGIDKAYLVGNFDGAIAALDMAINHPDRVLAMSLMGALGNTQGYDQEFLDTLKSLPLSDFKSFFINPEFQSRLVVSEKTDAFMEKYRNMWLTEPNFTSQQLGSIKAPTLILTGSSELFKRSEAPQELADAIPNAQIIRLEPDTIDIMGEAGAEYNETILDFLKDK
jgi:pimeloyl-ACP methyl ester carboxylesterase